LLLPLPSLTGARDIDRRCIADKLLRPNDRLVDILATYEELKKSMKLSKNIHIIDVDVQFVLKKLFFFEGPPERRDDIEINLLCWQAQNDLRCGRLWCSLAQVRTPN
jgi:hypothetical protein